MIDDTLLEAALDELSVTLGLSVRLAEPAHSLSGGFWATMYVVRLASDRPLHPSLAAPLVLRLMPSVEAGRFEAEVQRLVVDAGMCAPRVHAAGVIPSGKSSEWSWMVMDFAPGVPLLGGLSLRKVVSTLGAVRRIPATLAETTAQLHACDTSGWRERLITLGRDPAIAEFLARLRETAIAVGRLDLADHATRLAAAIPPDVVLCHGDVHPFNVVSDGQTTTLLDWSTAVLADRHYDLAFTELMLSNPPIPGPQLVRRVARVVGRALARRFLTSYERLSGRLVHASALEWGRQVHALRALVEVAAWRYAGTLDAHANHPWLALEQALSEVLRLRSSR